MPFFFESMEEYRPEFVTHWIPSFIMNRMRQIPALQLVSLVSYD